MLQHSRELLFRFIETTLGQDLHTPLQAYDNKSVRDLLEHSASCYFYWLGHFASGQPDRSLEKEDISSMPLVRSLYREVDVLVNGFLEKCDEDLNMPIMEDATPLQIFTQPFTHEFHHKGQIALMCRLLGYIPPDTDVRRSFPRED